MKKIILSCLALLLSTIALGGLYLWGFLAQYDVEPRDECISPSGRYVATSYFGSGGGAAGWTANCLALWDVEDGFDPDNRVYWVKNYKLHFNWLSDDHLLVTHWGEPRESEKTYDVGGHKVRISIRQRRHDDQYGAFSQKTSCSGRELTTFSQGTWWLFYWKEKK